MVIIWKGTNFLKVLIKSCYSVFRILKIIGNCANIGIIIIIIIVIGTLGHKVFYNERNILTRE